jgi:hypothetical protein
MRIPNDNVTFFKMLYKCMKVVEVETTTRIIATLQPGQQGRS